MRIRFHTAARQCREVGVRAVPRNWRRFERIARICERREFRVLAVDLELGAGNLLFMRGEGAGLSWGKGQPLRIIAPKTWIWSAQASIDKLEFLLLLNDQVWERGETHILAPGASIELTPDFEWPEIPRTTLPEAFAQRYF